MKENQMPTALRTPIAYMAACLLTGGLFVACAHQESSEPLVDSSAGKHHPWPTAVIIHENRLGSGFELVGATYLLDDQPIYYSPTGVGTLSRKAKAKVFDSYIRPGRHEVTVYLKYRPSASLFSYTEGYLYKVNTTGTFLAENGKRSMVRMVVERTGGLTTKFGQDLTVRFVSNDQNNPSLVSLNE